MIFSVFQKIWVFGYSWSTLLWYRCYYPHRSRDALSPVCGIFQESFSTLGEVTHIQHVYKIEPLDHIEYSGHIEHIDPRDHIEHVWHTYRLERIKTKQQILHIEQIARYQDCLQSCSSMCAVERHVGGSGVRGYQGGRRGSTRKGGRDNSGREDGELQPVGRVYENCKVDR